MNREGDGKRREGRRMREGRRGKEKEEEGN